MPHKQVHLTTDYLDRMARCRPERAIEELVWNGLDAGGPLVRVDFELNDLEAIQFITVQDFGSGIAFEDLERAFGAVGRSLKIDRKTTAEGRAFHGSEGFGRYRALSICSKATWTTKYKRDKKIYTYSITMQSGAQEGFDYTDPVETTDRDTGTIVRLENIGRGHQSLAAINAAEYMTERLALYLQKYNSVGVSYNGTALDPRSRIAKITPYELPKPEASVVVIDWTIDVPEKRLLICDAKGFAWHEVELNVPTRGLSLTAFLHCPEAREWDSAGRFVAGLDAEIAELAEMARDKVREHIVMRLALQASDIVASWKSEKIYPYSEDDKQSPISKAERQVFDTVAAQVHMHHPVFRNSPKPVKRLTLELMRQAMETNPGSLRRILEQVLTLSKEEQDTFAALFDSTHLSGMIAAASVVTERLKAIEGFDEIIHDAHWKKHLRERTQLHRLLVRQLWIFGDEYTLDNDDEPLRKILQKHIKHLGRD